MQTTTPTDLPYTLLLGEITQSASLHGLPAEETSTEDPSATQALTTAYITTMYYSALSNLYLQSLLPEDIATIDAEMPRLKIAIERSYADFTVAAAWIEKHGKAFVATSTARSYYEEVSSMDSANIKSISSAYPES